MVEVPKFPIGNTPEKRQPFDLAQEIANRINLLFGNEIAFAYNSFPDAIPPRALVVVKLMEGNNLQSLIFENISPSDFPKDSNMNFIRIEAIANTNPSQGINKEEDESCLAVNYADNNPQTIDLFVVQEVVRKDGIDNLEANAWNNTLSGEHPTVLRVRTGPRSELRNTLFFPFRDSTNPPYYASVVSHEVGHILTGLTHIDEYVYPLPPTPIGLHCLFPRENSVQGQKKVNLMEGEIRENDPEFRKNNVNLPKRLNCFQKNTVKSRLPLQ